MSLIAGTNMTFHLLAASLICSLISVKSLADCSPDIARTKPDSIYIDHGDGTISDNETGLTWMKCSIGQSGSACSGTADILNWKQALEAAQIVNNANDGHGTFGFTDWRLPNKKELSSLIERSCYSPAVNVAMFPGTVINNYYWSSSPFAGRDDYAWEVEFFYGYESPNNKFDFNHSVRLVRGGE